MPRAFVVGNGTSRLPINLKNLIDKGTVYGCNALYRDVTPHYLVAVDVKMVMELYAQGIHKKTQVWTNPNKAYAKYQGLNYFTPSKGWSSGPTALHLSASHKNTKIYILGFDYVGLGEEQDQINNVYAGSYNYKPVNNKATYFGNWLRQTATVIQSQPNKRFIRVVPESNAYDPKELSNFRNYETITTTNFIKIFE